MRLFGKTKTEHNLGSHLFWFTKDKNTKFGVSIHRNTYKGLQISIYYTGLRRSMNNVVRVTLLLSEWKCFTNTIMIINKGKEGVFTP
jgi:hypothetical protein